MLKLKLIGQPKPSDSAPLNLQTGYFVYCRLTTQLGTYPAKIHASDHLAPRALPDKTAKEMNNKITEKELFDHSPTLGNLDLVKAACRLDFDTILDIGCGQGAASAAFAASGKSVCSISLTKPKLFDNYFDALNINFRKTSFDKQYELDMSTGKKYSAIWLSHCLEHTSSPGTLLRKARDLLVDNGYLLVCVPPYKGLVVPGHLMPGWNIGILAYNMLAAGFNIREGMFIYYKYNICSFARKDPNLNSFLSYSEKEDDLIFDFELFGKRRTDFWPPQICKLMNERGHFPGDQKKVNWPTELEAAMQEPFSFHS